MIDVDLMRALGEEKQVNDVTKDTCDLNTNNPTWQELIEQMVDLKIEPIKKRLENLEKEITDIPELTVVPIRATAIIPSYAHEGDSGLDLYSAVDYTLSPGEKGIVPTGLVFVIPKTEWRTFDITVKGRSGNDSKGVEVVTTKMMFDDENGDSEVETTERKEVVIKTGTVDNIYTGEIGIIVKNNSYETIKIPAGTKLAQGIVREVVIPNIKVGTKEDIPDTERGSEGYGSTDKNN